MSDKSDTPRASRQLERDHTLVSAGQRILEWRDLCFSIESSLAASQSRCAELENSLSELRSASQHYETLRHTSVGGKIDCARERLHDAEMDADNLLATGGVGGMNMDDDDICGFCGNPGADKIPHPVRWPGEESAGTPYVHATCENSECIRAHSLLTDKQRERFLLSIYKD